MSTSWDEMFFCLCACEFVHVEGKNVAYAKCLFEHLDEAHWFFIRHVFTSAYLVLNQFLNNNKNYNFALCS